MEPRLAVLNSVAYKWSSRVLEQLIILIICWKYISFDPLIPLPSLLISNLLFFYLS
jgi:hypothetical protein